MKHLLIFCLLFCACSVPAYSNASSDLQLRVELTKGEHSKDSSSRTTTISIEPGVNTIVLEETTSGFHGHRRGTPPSRKEYKLSPADRRKLIALLKSKNLLVTKSIELPSGSSNYHYFAISIESAVGGKKGAISISGPATAEQVKEERLYQDAMALVEELRRIISRQDKSIVFGGIWNQ